jgi:tetratricopeptide (TPR) repeat protein
MHCKQDMRLAHGNTESPRQSTFATTTTSHSSRLEAAFDLARRLHERHHLQEPMNHHTISLLTLAVVAGACSFAPDYASARLRANELLERNPRQALRYLQDLDEETGGDKVLVLLRADAHARVGEHDRAIEIYRALAQEPDHLELNNLARNNLIATLYEAGRPDEAYEAFSLYSSSHRERPAVQRQMGVVAVACGRLEAARRHFATLPAKQQEEITAILGADFLNQQ